MDLEDLEPRSKQPKPKDLDAMGIAELEAYLGELEAEAARVKATIERKKGYLDAAAQGFFKGES